MRIAPAAHLERGLYPLECLSACTNRIQSAVQTSAKRFEL
jgi:hypothetical protein